MYNQAKVEDEFRRFFQYLKSRGLVRGVVEELELEELPGATGLKALRFELGGEGMSIKDIVPGEDLVRRIEEGLTIN